MTFQMLAQSKVNSFVFHFFIFVCHAKTHRVVLRENDARDFNSFQLHMRIFLHHNPSMELFTQALRQQWNRMHGSRFNLTRRHINMPRDVTQLQRHSYSDTQSVSLSCFRWITVENISAEGTGEARWQRTGILLKLQHVDIHVHHLPSLSSSQRSLCLSLQPSSSIKALRWQKTPLFDSDAKAQIGLVKENFTQKREIIYYSSCL